MKRLLRNTPILLVTVFLSLIFSACLDDNQDICVPTLSIEKFEQNIIDVLDGNVKGYAYVISKNGNAVADGAGGDARSDNDGQLSMTVNRKMQIASITKSITTAATLSVLEDKNVDINTSIENYLPPHWNPGPGVSGITFFDLLHQSPGLDMVGTQNFSATRYDSLKFYIETGATQPKNRFYSNTHHGMLRVVLPRLWDVVRPNGGRYDDNFCSSAFKQCIQAVIFDKIDVFNVECKPPANNPLLAYSSAGDNAGDGGTSDFTPIVGAMGWNMTAWETARYWAFLWNNNPFFGDEFFNLMVDEELGLWNSINGDRGRYYCKLGGWGFGNGSRLSSAVMQFPDEIQVTIFINSPAPGGLSLSVIGRDAYDDAYGCF